MKSFPHQTEPSCWLCRRSRGSCLGSQVCRAPWKCLSGTNITSCNFWREKVLRCHTDFVIECVVEHLPELLSGHVRVRVHHLEPVHVPGKVSLMSLSLYLKGECLLKFGVVHGNSVYRSNICWQKLVLTPDELLNLPRCLLRVKSVVLGHTINSHVHKHLFLGDVVLGFWVNSTWLCKLW